MDNLNIVLTKDPANFSFCAEMMAATDPWITLDMDFRQCLEAFEGEGKEVYLMLSDGNIAGFVILQIYGTFSGYIQTICIGKDFRGAGLGNKLLCFCEERIHKFSPNVFICVSSFNTGASRLYYKFGFKLVGELPDFVRKGFTELLLRKTIGPRAGYNAKK